MLIYAVRCAVEQYSVVVTRYETTVLRGDIPGCMQTTGDLMLVMTESRLTRGPSACAKTVTGVQSGKEPAREGTRSMRPERSGHGVGEAYARVAQARVRILICESIVELENLSCDAMWSVVVTISVLAS